MKKNKLFRKIIVFTVMFVLFNTIIITNVSQAIEGLSQEEIKSKLYNTDVITSGNAKDIYEKGGNALWLVQAAGIVTGVIMIAYIGFTYILASPEGKSDLKERMPVYVIGAFLIMGATTVVRIVGDIAHSVL